VIKLKGVLFMAKVRGLSVDIYRSASFGDCSNNGVTARYNEAILIGDGVTGPEEVDLDNPPENVFLLVQRDIRNVGEYLHAEPLDGHYGGGGKWYMFGGNCIYTSDSRFPNSYPIKVHDRRE